MINGRALSRHVHGSQVPPLDGDSVLHNYAGSGALEFRVLICRVDCWGCRARVGTPKRLRRAGIAQSVRSPPQIRLQVFCRIPIIQPITADLQGVLSVYRFRLHNPLAMSAIFSVTARICRQSGNLSSKQAGWFH